METLKFVLTNSISPFGYGGDAQHVKLLSYELSKLGHEVYVVYNNDALTLMKNLYSHISEEYQNTRCDNIRYVDISSPLGQYDAICTYAIGSSHHYHNKYKSLIKQIKPDVVHHHDVTFLGYNFFEKLGDYIQFYTAHNYWLICPNRELYHNMKTCNSSSSCSLCLLSTKRPPQIWRWFHKINKITANIDAIIAPSIFIKKTLEKTINNEIVYIPNFIVNCPETTSIQSNYLNFILYVGQLEERKGILNLLKTFLRDKDKITLNLIIVGSGSLEQQIKNFIVKNKISHRVLFLGKVHRKKLWSLYNEATAVVIPSIWQENNPLVALEALSVGTPIIGTNVGGLKEIVELINVKLTFDSNISKCTNFLLENKHIINKTYIKNIFNKYYTPNSYLNAYTQLMDRHK